MISGNVNARLEAILPLRIEDSTGHLHPIEPIIDTGFTGDLTLPSAQISTLALSWSARINVRMADGSQQTVDAYDALLEWDGNVIQVVETEPLLGTRLLSGHEVKAHFLPSGAVTVTPIP